MKRWQKEPIHAWAPCIQVAYSHFEQGCILHSKKRVFKPHAHFTVTLPWHTIKSHLNCQVCENKARYRQRASTHCFIEFYAYLQSQKWIGSLLFLLACSDFKWCRFTCHLEQIQFFFEVHNNAMQLSNFTLIWHLILLEKEN